MRDGRCVVSAAKKLAGELRELRSMLGDAIAHVIETRQQDDFQLEAFEKALVTLTTVRFCLADEADKLDAEAVTR